MSDSIALASRTNDKIGFCDIGVTREVFIAAADEPTDKWDDEKIIVRTGINALRRGIEYTIVRGQ